MKANQAEEGRLSALNIMDDKWRSRAIYLIHDKWQTITYQEGDPEFGRRNRIRESLKTWLDQVTTGQMQKEALLSSDQLLELSGQELSKQELFEASFFGIAPLSLFTLEFWVIDKEKNLLFKIESKLGFDMLQGKEVQVIVPDEFQEITDPKSQTVLMFKIVDQETQV